MSNRFDFCFFYSGPRVTDIVAPKSKFTKEEFLETALFESEGYDWNEEVRAKNVREGYVRWYPIPPEGCEAEGGCYSFGKSGRGAIPVWYIRIW